VLANDSERVAVKVAKQLLIDAGISEKTIWRAKTSLGVVTHADGSGPKTKHHWCLPKDSKLVDQLRRELNLPDSPPSADNEEGKGEGQQAA
jgi:hypothetical protein